MGEDKILLVICVQQEGEVGALTRRIALLEVDYEQTSARLSTASDKLDEASKHAEEAERLVRCIDDTVKVKVCHLYSASSELLHF